MKAGHATRRQVQTGSGNEAELHQVVLCSIIPVFFAEVNWT